MSLQAGIDLFSALLTPLVAAIAVYIAYQQWQTNRRKLDLDLYDRRLRIYQTVSRFISKVLTDLFPEPQDFSEYWRDTAEADFLFGSDIRDYVRTLAKRAAQLRRWRSEYRDYSQPKNKDYDHDKVVAGTEQETRWFAAQPEAARRLFAKYLSVAPEHRTWRKDAGKRC